jgi:chromosome segregation ATPase
MVHNHPLSFGGGDQHNEIFQLQIEIQSLKNRLKQASSAQKHELLELLQEKDTVIQTKSKQISTLNEKFLKITKAVAQMEREVEVLRRDKDVLEEDHKKLKRHLNIREKEVTALVTRCTAQEEKLVELKSSRVLEKQLQEVQAKLEESDRHVREMEDLDRQLLQSNREREDVMHRFEKEKEEKETLQRHLSDTKEQLEGQLKSRDESLVQLREQVEALTLSRDQKDAQCRELGKTVEDLQQKVTDMEISAQNNKVEYEREIARLEEQISQENRQHKDIVESLQRSKEQDMEMMKLQMQKGDQAMASVLNEVHVLKHENNALQKSVKDLDTERNTMIENLSSEKQALQEHLENLKNELDVKTKEAMKLNDVVQKIKEQQQQSLMETTTFKEKIGSLEDQVEMLTAREKQLTMEKQQVLDQNTSLSREMEDMKKVSLYWLFFFPF